jgi:hypothetical protein
MQSRRAASGGEPRRRDGLLCVTSVRTARPRSVNQSEIRERTGRATAALKENSMATVIDHDVELSRSGMLPEVAAFFADSPLQGAIGGRDAPAKDGGTSRRWIRGPASRSPKSRR